MRAGTRDTASGMWALLGTRYRHTLAHLKAYFCGTPIDEINTIHINALLDQLHEEGASRSKIGKCRTMMIQILDYAEATNLLVKNPARRAKTMRSFKAVRSSKKTLLHRMSRTV